jgi:hypothetical protein
VRRNWLWSSALVVGAFLALLFGLFVAFGLLLVHRAFLQP